MRPGIALSSLLPQEHGAYGQICVALVTAFAIAGASTAGLLFTLAAVAGFVAHEPAAILLGHRGGRARRALCGAARTWLAASVTVLAVAGAAAAFAIGPSARWSIAVAIVPAVLLALATARGRDKSMAGEVIAALAFSAATLPVCMAAGVPTATAIAIAIPLALLFIGSTLAVRVTILQVRGGGNRRAASTTRLVTFVLAGAAVVGLSIAIAVDRLSPSVLAAASPGLLTAVVVAAHPPSPTRLRGLGWTLIGVSVLTAAIIVGTA